MGNSEEGNPCKIEKPSSPLKDQSTAHLYPDWATMQAYYGPQFTMLPYLNLAVASPHIPPPYMWMVPPQYMLPPHGAPYPVYYAHEGAYGHPGVSMAGTPLSTDTPAELTGNTDGGFVKKKWKDSQGLAVSIGNGNADSCKHGPDHRLSESEVTDDSSDGIDGVTAEAGQSGMKRSRAGSSKSAAKDQKRDSAEVGRAYESMRETSCPPNTAAKTIENTSTLSELKEPSVLNVKPIAAYGLQSSIGNQAWLQGTQNEQELKWEKRKQSNRDSAKRSRLRKQAEAEELATKVERLITENMTLKSEVDKFTKISKKLELENATLMEKLKDSQPGEVNFLKIDGVRPTPVDTVNLLARVNINGSTDRTDEDGDSYEQRSSLAKLHQLLDAAIASPRADVLAAR